MHRVDSCLVLCARKFGRVPSGRAAQESRGDRVLAPKGCPGDTAARILLESYPVDCPGASDVNAGYSRNKFSSVQVQALCDVL